MAPTVKSTWRNGRRNTETNRYASRSDYEYAGDDRRCGKALDNKGVFTNDEFKAQLGAERANYLAVLKRLH
jgi:hypothetical protein